MYRLDTGGVECDGFPLDGLSGIAVRAAGDNTQHCPLLAKVWEGSRYREAQVECFSAIHHGVSVVVTGGD